MELLVFRHGIAEEREEFALKYPHQDHLRPLTLKGRKRVQKMGIKLLDWMPDIDLIVSSPYVRARQTAEILSQIYYEMPVVEAPELAPHSPPVAFLKWLKAHARDKKQVIMVGHEPHLSTFASYVLSGKEQSFIELKKGGLLCLEMEYFDPSQVGAAQLKWCLPPKLVLD